MIIDTDSHLRENYFLDEMYKLDAPFADLTPERIVDGPPPQRQFRSRLVGGPSGARGYNHSYMYDPSSGWRGGEIAARQVTGWDMEKRVEANAREQLDKQFIFPTSIWPPTTVLTGTPSVPLVAPVVVNRPFTLNCGADPPPFTIEASD